MLADFLKVKGGGSKVAFLIGYPPTKEKKIVLEKDMSPMVVRLKYLRQE